MAGKSDEFKVAVQHFDQLGRVRLSRSIENIATEDPTNEQHGIKVETRVYGYEVSSLNLMSKVTYEYDEGDFSDTGLGQDISPVQHDSANYDDEFIVGRGNLTSMTRWSVEYPTTSGEAVTSSLKYNTAGSVVARTTPWDGTNPRTIKIGYADNWNSTGNPATYAYPTSLTDPANTASTVKYRYDIGANVEAASPAPAGQTYGKTTKRVFDAVGRLQKHSVYVNTAEQAYTRYEYPANGVQSKVYTTLVDTNANGPDGADEVLSESWADGAGRTRRSRVPHTFDGAGDTETWAGTITEYDILGRVARQSVPTEVDGSWEPDGDDTAFLWTHQKYDWMGRVIRKIATDGADSPTLNDSDVLISYEGCGCAGGMVTTVEGERVPIPGTENFARRKQKVYQDILGRTFKTEAYEWDGTTLYATAVNTFNGRDQVTRTREFAGSASSETFQDTTATFDGHGRLKTSHRPEQRSGETLKYTTYNYNPDDSILNITDGRGVVTNYTYNSRGLVEEMTWDVGETGVTDAHDVEFGYDALGNRTSMTDGLGTVAYEYDPLSRMTAETRDFIDTLANAPNGVFRLEYTYTQGGQLKSLKDPYGEQINYAHDKLSRLSTVTGSSFGGVTSYASSPHYRAWGGLQSLSFGNATSMSVEFDTRLRPAVFEMVKSGQQDPIMEKTYEYHSDGRLRKLSDAVDDRFDRLNEYDQMGRITSARTGLEARGGTPTTQPELEAIPYRQSYEYNAFGNTTERVNDMWGTHNFSAERTFVNNRIQNQSQTVWEYDADGRITDNGGATLSTYNAAGQLIVYNRQLVPAGENEVTRHYNGDGMEEKRTQRILKEIEPEEWEWEQQPAKYYIRSTVLGGAVVTDVYDIGTKKRTYVRAGGQEIAWQNGDSGGSVVFQATDPVGASIRSAESDGDIFDAQGTESSPAELDPMGGNVATENPFVTQTGGSSCVGCGMLDETMPFWAMGGEPRITHNGFPISHEEAAMMADAGNLAMEIVHAARGRIEIFGNVPVGGILGNLVMPSHYRLLRAESNQDAIEITGGRFIENTIASLSDCVSQLLTVNNNRSNPIAQEFRESAMAAIIAAASQASMIVEQLAYALATAEVETTYFTALRETYGKPPPFGTKEAFEWSAKQAPYFNKKYDGIIGNVSGTNDGFYFRGGGYVQLTGRANYARFGLDESNVGSVTNPTTAARILVQGLLDGTFTEGKERIGTYINGQNTDFYNARKVINGNELITKPSKVREIERFANRYLRALKQCR